MLFSQPKLRPGKAGTIAEGGSCRKITNYSTNSLGTCDETKFKLTNFTEVPTVCGAECSEANTVVISITPPARCCSAPIEIGIPVRDLMEAPNAEAMGMTVLCAINATPQAVALGSFGYDASTNEFTFKARFPGFPVDFAISGPVASEITTVPALSGNEGLTSGYAVTVDPANGWDVASHPTEDVSLATSKECWAGVVLACEGGGERAPAVASWPNFSNCNSECAPAQTCIRVLEEGTIWLQLQAEPTGCNLYYKFEGDDRGAFSGVPGAGWAAVPVKHRVKDCYGTLAKVQFG